jgi:hypothetical protein
MSSQPWQDQDLTPEEAANLYWDAQWEEAFDAQPGYAHHPYWTQFEGAAAPQQEPAAANIQENEHGHEVVAEEGPTAHQHPWNLATNYGEDVWIVTDDDALAWLDWRHIPAPTEAALSAYINRRFYLYAHNTPAQPSEDEHAAHQGTDNDDGAAN